MLGRGAWFVLMGVVKIGRLDEGLENMKMQDVSAWAFAEIKIMDILLAQLAWYFSRWK